MVLGLAATVVLGVVVFFILRAAANLLDRRVGTDFDRRTER